MTATQTKTLQTKTVGPYTAEGMIAGPADTISTPAYDVFRFVDENGKGGCWYSTLEKAETSWNRR